MLLLCCPQHKLQHVPHAAAAAGGFNLSKQQKRGQREGERGGRVQGAGVAPWPSND